MSTWVWVVIAVAAALAIAAVLWAVASRARSTRLRQRFGSEYDRTVEGADSRREAESELSARVARRKELDIRPLSQQARERYAAQWQDVQASFVDDPKAAIGRADSLVYTVMAERGYPMEDFEQRAADVSVDYPHVVEHYRGAHATAQRSENGDASTEELRQAVQHYRALFDELLESAPDEQMTRDRTAGDRIPADEEVTRR